MPYSVCAPRSYDKFSEHVRLAALTRVIPATVIAEVAARHQHRFARVRMFDVLALLWLLTAQYLFAPKGLPRVLATLVHTARLLSTQPDRRLPSAAAIAQRRRQLGGAAMQDLFHAVCHPIATPQTPGAFRFGRRVMAIDGSIDNLVATPANTRVFARKQSQRGLSAFPQVLGVYLVECGTHIICDVGFWSGTTSEHVAVRRLLRSIQADMLILWDRGFHSADLIRAIQARGAHVIGRLPAHVQPIPRYRLADGSVLAWIRAPEPRQPSIAVRLVMYQVQGQGAQEPICLVTTLLDAAHAPAHALAQTYHERWESELVFDELGTHLCLSEQTLTSHAPYGVIQELYGLLLAHYVIRSIMHTAAVQQDIDPDTLSFTAALDIVSEAIRDFQIVAPAQWDCLWQQILTEVAHCRLPPRRPRSSPRQVCRSRSKYRQKSMGQASGRRLACTYDTLLIVDHSFHVEVPLLS
jgi:hypothetical protein